MAVNLFEGQFMLLAPGQTREILQGNPEFLKPGTFNGISIITYPASQPVRVTLVATFVVRDLAGNNRQGFVARNESPSASVEIRRTTVEISP